MFRCQNMENPAINGSIVTDTFYMEFRRLSQSRLKNIKKQHNQKGAYK